MSVLLAGGGRHVAQRHAFDATFREKPFGVFDERSAGGVAPLGNVCHPSKLRQVS